MQIHKGHITITVFIFFNLLFYLLVLPHIDLNLPWVYTCSPSWTPFPPPSPSHPLGSSQRTSSEHPVSCIKPGLVILHMIIYTYDNIHMIFHIWYMIWFHIMLWNHNTHDNMNIYFIISYHVYDNIHVSMLAYHLNLRLAELMSVYKSERWQYMDSSKQWWAGKFSTKKKQLWCVTCQFL